MLSILCVRLTIKVKVGIPGSFKVGWYPNQKTGSSHLNCLNIVATETSATKVISRKYKFHVLYLNERC